MAAREPPYSHTAHKPRAPPAAHAKLPAISPFVIPAPGGPLVLQPGRGQRSPASLATGSDSKSVVVSTVARMHRQSWTTAILAALSQFSRPAFLPNSGRLLAQVSSAKQLGLERCPVRPTIAPPHFVQAHPPAGLACQSLPGCPSGRRLPPDL